MLLEGVDTGLGGSPGALPGAQLLVGDFDGDGKTDVLVFRARRRLRREVVQRPPSVQPGGGPFFAYESPQYIGGSPDAFPGAQLLVGDFDGDRKDDVLVFRASDGYVAKWYSNTPRSPVFDEHPLLRPGFSILNV